MFTLNSFMLFGLKKLSTYVSYFPVTVGAGVPEGRIKMAAALGSMIRLGLQ